MLNWIKRHRRNLLVGLLLLVLVAILFQTGAKKQPSSTFSSIAHTLAYPFQSVFHAVVDQISGWGHHYLNLVNLREENERLKQQVLHLQEELNQSLEESIQYNRLKVQMEFAELHPEQHLFAEVIGESVDSFHQTLQINRGTRHGIARNFAVILREGVVGRIQATTAFQSTIQLILDHRSRFPAIVQRTRAKGIVYGTSDGLELHRIHLRSDVKVGDRIVTNGLGGLFPKGLLVGTVVEVEQEEHTLFQSAKLEPSVDFNKIENVFVILTPSQLQPSFSLSQQ